MGDLCFTYRINEHNLRLRREFMRFTEQDVQVLRELAPWAARVAPALAQEFYDFQFTFGPSLAFFESNARRKNMTVEGLRRALEQAQAGYFREIFEEAMRGGEYGPAYFERRLHVGKLHNVIDLPLKWYIGSYALYMDLVRQYLERDFRWKFRFRTRAERAIFTVFNFDSQAVTDAFFYDYLQSIGFDLDTIEVARPDHDLSEYYAALKDTVRGALAETVSVGTGVSASARDLRSAADHLAQSANQQAAALQETTTTLNQLMATITATFGRVQEASRLTVGEVGRTDGPPTVVSVMAEIRESAEKIASIVSAIDQIAAQTNLLALNATIEAARAGEHGRGFGVVAGEVRDLSQSSARSARDIAGLIDTMNRQAEGATGFVKQVADLVAGIASTAQEQSEALQQMSSAMSQMDQSTHMNAGQTEELAVTSRTLEEQAARLTQALSRFKLERLTGRAGTGTPGPDGRAERGRRSGGPPLAIAS